MESNARTIFNLDIPLNTPVSLRMPVYWCSSLNRFPKSVIRRFSNGKGTQHHTPATHYWSRAVVCAVWARLKADGYAGGPDGAVVVTAADDHSVRLFLANVVGGEFKGSAVIHVGHCWELTQASTTSRRRCRRLQVIRSPLWPMERVDCRSGGFRLSKIASAFCEKNCRNTILVAVSLLSSVDSEGVAFPGATGETD
eukprot:346972-Prorocentrum_minimum.AAC.1